MNIDRVLFKGLFDNFDHDLAFGAGERVMLVIGPNGFGKTTTLNLIDTLFNREPSSLVNVPFREIDVFFNDETRLIIERLPISSRDYGDYLPIKLTYHQDGESQTYSPPQVSIDPKDLGFPLSAIEDFIPMLAQVGPREWRDMETGSLLNLAEVFSVYGDHFPPSRGPIVLTSPEWLEKIRKSIKVRFVDAERLTRVQYSRRWRHGHTVNPTRTVSHHSEQLAQRIAHSIAEYGALSQDLDRTFPNRVVAEHQESNGSAEKLREDLDAIDQKRSQLEEVGLLRKEQDRLKIPNLKNIDEAHRGVLAVYVQDAERKLAVFDELYQQVSTFTKIANSRFLHKKVAVGTKGLRVSRKDGTTLDLEKLSSGEQHELVMLYELLFRASSNSLILIDEPELSLHVAWQEKWVEDLEEIAELSDFRAIVATHSPEIIGGRWSRTVELKGRNNA